MITQKKLHHQIAALKAQKTKIETEMQTISTQPIRNDMALHRLMTRNRQLDEDIKTLESHLIPDIIA
ncbi:MAG TPA: hypothetical protein DCW68_04455 [Rhodospirillaceae bacterium]|nr:MAG: hypothetical protein A2018_03195 [Alphaproteobacteria bacterium GWF2_58_20]HAU29348.1 hypothetical protein [Rhodospirillaceae bacterium]